MSQPALPPPNTARLAITSFCNLLRHHGITSLEPELIRQAKFDGPAAGPLWRVLHDTVLVVLAGCPDGHTCQAALARQWSQVSLEQLSSGDEELPHEAAALVIRQLAVWGAPPELLRELGPGPDPDSCMQSGSLDAAHQLDSGSRANCGPAWPHVRSRPLLLALGWLVAAAGLFERRIGELEPAPGLRALLPPYPPDACDSPAVQAAYDGAAREAREHVQRLAPAATGVCGGAGGIAAAAAVAGGRAGGSRGRGIGADPFGSPATAEALWGEVEAAAQRAVMLCGRIRTRLVTLQAGTDCRNRLSHSLWARQAASAPCSRPLTPYELQLCAQPATMQRHMAALETATLALLEQQELASHGALFFEWLGSAMEEEAQHQNQRRQQRQQGGRRGGGAHRNTEAGRAGGGATGAGGGGGSLSALESLPYLMSDAGTRLAAHLEAQLEVAVQAAEPEISAARRRAEEALRRGPSPTSHTGPSGGARPAAAAAAVVTIDQFLELAEQAVSDEQLFTQDPQSGNGDSGGSGGGGSGGPSGGGSGSSGLPLLVGGSGAAAASEADSTGAWRLPEDLAEALEAVQIAEQRRSGAAEEEAARFRQLRYAALSRYDFQAGAAGPPGAAGGGGVSAAAETQRLLGVVLAAARPLARTRAAHKAALLAALQDLPEGYLAAGL